MDHDCLRVNQPVCHFMRSVKKTLVGNQIQKQTNIKHVEVNLQMKRACLCTQKSGPNLIEEVWCGQEMFKKSIKEE